MNDDIHIKDLISDKLIHSEKPCSKCGDYLASIHFKDRDICVYCFADGMINFYRKDLVRTKQEDLAAEKVKNEILEKQRNDLIVEKVNGWTKQAANDDLENILKEFNP